MITGTKSVKITEGMLRRAHIPKGCWDKRTGAVENVVLRQEMESHIFGMAGFLTDSKGLLVQGPICTGKTVFACMLLREAMLYGAVTFFVRAFELQDWRNEIGLYNTGITWEQRVKSSDLVVLDDLGGEGEIGRKKILPIMEYMLRYRYEEGRNTIITTNLAASKFKKHYGGVLESLLERSCSRVLISTDQFRGSGQ